MCIFLLKVAIFNYIEFVLTIIHYESLLGPGKTEKSYTDELSKKGLVQFLGDYSAYLCQISTSANSLEFFTSKFPDQEHINLYCDQIGSNCNIGVEMLGRKRLGEFRF